MSDHREGTEQRQVTATDENKKAPLFATWLAFVGTFLLFVCVAHGTFETTDAGFTMHAARSLWHRGDSALLTAEQGGEHLGAELVHVRSSIVPQRRG